MSRRNFYFFSNYFCRRLIKIYPYKNIRKILNIKCEIGKNPPRTKMATNRAILSITRFEKKSHTLLPKETTSTEMPFLNPICFGQYKMRGQNQSDKTKNF